MENDKLIRLPIIYDAGGDLKKEWFVEFYVRNPKTNALRINSSAKASIASGESSAGP